MIRRLALILTVRGPVFTRSNAVGLFGIDAPIARTSDGTPYLPGTLVLGRLAEALRQLGRAQRAARRDATCLDDLRDFFAWSEETGAIGDETEGRGRRRRIFASDFVAAHKGQAEHLDAVRTRIALDNATGSVLTGAIQVIESPYRSGEEVEFQGEIRLLGEAARIEAFALRLQKALQWIAQWGGFRSLGFGEAVSARLSEVQGISSPARPRAAEVASGPRDLDDDTRLLIALDFHDLLCVGEQRTGDNLYESSDVIAGGVLKGALASQILARHGRSGAISGLKGTPTGPTDVLADVFDALTFRHAFPVGATSLQRSTAPLPLSLAAAKTKGGPDGELEQTVLMDAAFLAQPNDAFTVGGIAPTFIPDWKDSVFAMADETFARPFVKTELRLRTKIDPELRAADSGKLFAIAYRRTNEHRWIGEVDLSAIEAHARPDVRAALKHATMDGLAGIGRGGAYASVKWIETAPERQTVAPGSVVLMLRTPALLRPPEPSLRGDVTFAYRQAFSELLGADDPVDAVRLKTLFVRERLAGADFMARRLPKGSTYRPFLLTEAGSVFVFDVTKEGREMISDWLGKGLAIPHSTLKAYGLDASEQLWRYCPYLPENGYGEFMLRRAADDIAAGRNLLTEAGGDIAYITDGGEPGGAQ